MEYTTLIEREIGHLERELEILSLILRKREHQPLDAIEIRGAALTLTSLYNGMESILKHILAAREENVKDSPAWHMTVLLKSQSLGIISEKTVSELKGFLGFRHFVRHAYTFDIDPNAIESVLDAAPPLINVFIEEVRMKIRTDSGSQDE